MLFVKVTYINVKKVNWNDMTQQPLFSHEEKLKTVLELIEGVSHLKTKNFLLLILMLMVLKGTQNE